MLEKKNMMNIAILLSGGTGSRLNASIPKQYIRVNHKMILTYSLETLMNHPQIDGILVVADSMWQEEILSELNTQVCKKKSSEPFLDCKLYRDDKNYKVEKFIGFAQPGETRQVSILNGLQELQRRKDISVQNVLIHDAARPNLSFDMITKCMDALKEHEGVMPVLPMKDTIYISENGTAVTGLLDRSKLFAGQAPEGFRFDMYLRANVALLPNELWKINGSTEPAIQAGMDVVMISGDENNYKITTPKDLLRFKETIESDSDVDTFYSESREL